VYDVLVSDNGPPLRWFCDECDDSWKKPGNADLLEIMTRLMHKLERIEDRLESEIESMHNKMEGVEDKMEKVLGTVDSQMKGLASKVEGMVASLEKTVKTQGKVDGDQLITKISVHDETVHRRLEEKVDDVMKAIGTQQFDAAKILEGAIKIQTEETREEEEDMRRRKVNVIVHGLGEPKGTSAAERENEDKDTTEELLHVLSCDTISVNQVTRLGAAPSDLTVKPRPLRISFKSELSRDLVLKKAKNLRGKEGGWSRVFIHQDLTPKQREARKKLVQELQDRKSNGETNLIIVNGKIITRRV